MKFLAKVYLLDLICQIVLQYYLNQVLENQAPITIWQSSTQQLFQLKGNLTVVDEKKCTVSIAENDFELHDSEGIYFHCEGVDIIFKRGCF